MIQRRELFSSIEALQFVQLLSAFWHRLTPLLDRSHSGHFAQVDACCLTHPKSPAGYRNSRAMGISRRLRERSGWSWMREQLHGTALLFCCRFCEKLQIEWRMKRLLSSVFPLDKWRGTLEILQNDGVFSRRKKGSRRRSRRKRKNRGRGNRRRRDTVGEINERRRIEIRRRGRWSKSEGEGGTRDRDRNWKSSIIGWVRHGDGKEDKEGREEEEKT